MAGIKFPEPAAQNSKFNAVDLDVEGGENAPVLHVDTSPKPYFVQVPFEGVV